MFSVGYHELYRTGDVCLWSCVTETGSSYVQDIPVTETVESLSLYNDEMLGASKASFAGLVLYLVFDRTEHHSSVS